MKKASHAGRQTLDLGDRLDHAAAVVRRKLRQQPRLGMILGTGFHAVQDAAGAKVKIPCSRLPGLPRPTVAGHAGVIVAGALGGSPVLMLSGRPHYYEGHTMEAVTVGVRLLARLGIEAVIITNAAGAINRRFRTGDFMMLTDHINAMGVNPLRGMSGDGQAPFVDLTEAYDLELQAMLQRAARRTGVSLRQGIYLAVSGPSYETPAEIRAFRAWGADAVGMSTVPEVIVARQEGLRVAGLSSITNLAAGLGGTPLSHPEVLEMGIRASHKAVRLMEEFARLYGGA